MLVFGAIIIPVGMLIGSRGQLSKATITPLPLLLFLLLISSTIGGINGNKLWKSYCLILSNTSIVKKQNGYRDIEIPFEKISKAIEIPNKGLIIFSQTLKSQIHIPSLISEYTVIRDILRKSHVTIEIESQSNKNYLAGIFATLFLAAFVVTFISDNLWVMSVTGIPISLFLIASMIRLQGDLNTPKLIKQWSWLAVLPVFSIVLRILLSLVSGE
jgi:hypothetical protein